MNRILTVAGALAAGLAFGAPGSVAQAAPVYYDAHGKPYVVRHNGKKQTRYYCRKALYGEVKCPTSGKQLRYGPYDRDFAFSQGYQILR